MENLDYTSHTILIAEDNESNLEFIRQTFMHTGLTILNAYNGREAIDCCRNHPEIKLILMDGMMPVMTGYDATLEIRTFRPELPIIVLTAYVSQTSIRDAVYSGCTDYIAKPVDTEELFSILKKWLVD